MKNVLQVQMEPKATRVQDDNPEDLFRERLQWEPNRPLLQGTRVPKLTGTKGLAWGKWFLLRRFRGRKSNKINHWKFRWVDDPSPPLKYILGWWSIPYWWPIPDTTNEWWTVLLATLQMDCSDVKLKLFTVYSTSKPLHLPTESHGFIHYFQGTLELLRGSSLSMLSERPLAEIWAVQNKFQLQQCQVSWEYHLDTC